MIPHRSPALAIVLLATAVATASQGRPVIEPEPLAGAWETAQAAGVDGIFLSISIHTQGTTQPPGTSTRNVHIRLYHREAGKETGGWYTAAGPGALDQPAVLDGEHLRLRAVSDGPVIDVMFEPGKQRWTGTWTRDGRSQDVVLERPHANPGALSNVILGDWEGLPDPVGPGHAPTRLHIYESADGALTAWMDRNIVLIDQRRGELLQVTASENRGITLDTTSAGGMRYRFRGTVSADGSTLVGAWQRNGTGGGTLNAATSFRRIR
jgi:hypothetical protein